MTSTIYIPKEQEQIMLDFQKKCRDNNKSYSSTLIELMKAFNESEVSFPTAIQITLAKIS